jgi:hypothetical protein
MPRDPPVTSATLPVALAAGFLRANPKNELEMTRSFLLKRFGREHVGGVPVNIRPRVHRTGRLPWSMVNPF